MTKQTNKNINGQIWAAEEFTSGEIEALETFFTNLDSPVFAFDGIPQQVAGALISRFSRTNKPIRRLFMTEFLGEGAIKEGLPKHHKGSDLGREQSELFYDRVLSEYGDDSVAQVAGAHLVFEGISQLAIKEIEDNRLTAEIEQSTRYIPFDKKVNDEYRFFQPSEIMNSKFAEGYLETCNLLVDTYSAMAGRMKDFFSSRYPQEEGVSDQVYRSSINAKAFDSVRGLLPASVQASFGMFGSGQSYEHMLNKLNAANLQEMHDLADRAEMELQKVVPSFVKRVKHEYGQAAQDYYRTNRNNTNKLIQDLKWDKPVGEEKQPGVTLAHYDKDGEEQVLIAILKKFTGRTHSEVTKKASQLTDEERREIFVTYIGSQANRRHRPYRAFEHSFYTFDFEADFGAYRDLQRHRILTQERSLITTDLGFYVPASIKEAEEDEIYLEALGRAKEFFNLIREEMPEPAQYVVPLASNIRWSMKMNAREVAHIAPLRSIKQGHPSYRVLAQEMARQIAEVHPLINMALKYVDFNDYDDLERKEALARAEEKVKAIEEKISKDA